MARRYDMSGREAARRHTREQILDAAAELFGPAWFDEVTLGDVAARAGVSQQTVVNHFGSKIGLYLAGISERALPEIEATRKRAVKGDVSSIVAAVVEDYERSGDSTFRNVALADRVEDLQSLVAGGRRAHRGFVEGAFAPLLPRRRADRERVVRLLAAVLDVTMWRQLRRLDGLGVADTRAHLEVLVRATLAEAG